jgi:hypothetical protein
LLGYFDGELKVIDEKKFNSWLNYDVKHRNSLNMNNEVVQKVFNKFNNENRFTLYCYLRQYYWGYCDTLEEFENDINEKINDLQNIRELFKT